MKSFVAYIDFIAYTDFILQNPKAYSDHRVSNILRDIETSVETVKRQHPEAVHAVRCVNIADTLIFFTLGNKSEDLYYLLRIVYEYNKKSLTFGFPQRGAIVYGDLETVHNSLGPTIDGKPVINMLKGRPLIEAERKTENLLWAGIVIDKSIEEFLTRHSKDVAEFLTPFAIPYTAPYADNRDTKTEYCMRLGRSNLTQRTIESLKKSVEDNFAKINITNFNMERRAFLENTLIFIDQFSDSANAKQPQNGVTEV